MRGPSDVVQRVLRKWTVQGVLNPAAAAEDWTQAGLGALRAPEDLRALYTLSNGMAVMDTDLLFFSPLKKIADDRALYPLYSASNTTQLWTVADWSISVWDFAMDCSTEECPVLRCPAEATPSLRAAGSAPFAPSFTELLRMYVDRPEAFWM